MPRTLSYTDTALADLEAAKTWLTQPGAGPAAWAKLDAILSAIEDLRDHPCRWLPGRHSGVRERPPWAPRSLASEPTCPRKRFFFEKKNQKTFTSLG